MCVTSNLFGIKFGFNFVVLVAENVCFIIFGFQLLLVYNNMLSIPTIENERNKMLILLAISDFCIPTYDTVAFCYSLLLVHKTNSTEHASLCWLFILNLLMNTHLH